MDLLADIFNNSNYAEELLGIGITVITSIMVFVKKFVKTNLNQALLSPYYPILMNVVTFFVSFSYMLLSLIVIDNSFQTVMVISVIIFLSATGLYESAVNGIRSTIRKKVL
jgi:hypothetical protein